MFLILCMVISISTPVHAAAKINKSKATLYVGQTVNLKITGTGKKVTWSTSNKAVATVKAGKVTAKKKGVATITAKVSGKKYTCKVTVKDYTLKLSQDTVEIGNHKQKVIQVETNAKKFTATTKDTDIIQVFYQNNSDSSIILFFTLSTGTATITVKAGNVTKKVTVTVTDGEELISHDEFNWTKEIAEDNEGYINFVDWSVNEYNRTQELYYITFSEDVAEELVVQNHGVTIGTTWEEITQLYPAWSYVDSYGDDDAMFSEDYIDPESGLHFYKIFVFDGKATTPEATNVKEIVWYCYMPSSY